MSNNPDHLENQQDQEQENKRPVLFIPLIIIALLLVISVASYAIASSVGLLRSSAPEPTEIDEPTEVAEVTEVVEQTKEATFTAAPTDEATDEPTPTATETEEPTESPTDTPTPTRRPPVVVTEATDEPLVICGDYICDSGENVDSCVKDCGCFEDNYCTRAEAAIGTCRDCSNPGTCGAGCTSNAHCNTAQGYACVNGFCDAPSCDPKTTPKPTDEPTPTTEPTTEPTVEPTVEPTDPQPVCGCKGVDYYCDGNLVRPEDPQCLPTTCTCQYWYPASEAQQGPCDTYPGGVNEPGYAYYFCGYGSDNMPIEHYPAMTCGEAVAYGCFNPK